MKRVMIILGVMALCFSASAEVTLQQCHDAAAKNYPEIKKYDLVGVATEYDISNAKKAYLPQVQGYAQATWQNAVSSFPDNVKQLYSQMGIDMAGMSKDQYKIGIDASQTIWDGGKTKAEIDQLKASDKVTRAKSDLTIYQVRQKINDLYFGILMLEANLNQNAEKIKVLESNNELLKSYVKGGVATVADQQRVEAELISTQQQRMSIQETDKAYRKVLGIFTGMDLTNETFVTPDDIIVNGEVNGNHPQLAMIEAQRESLEAQRSSIKASLMPQISAFGTGYWGKPGLDMFNAMFKNEFSWNFLVGVKATWNIGGLYRYKNNEAKIANAEKELDVARDNFLFNTSLETATKEGAINAKQKELTQDDKIIELRGSVRKATESKLKHGIIVSDDLIKDVSAEHLAKLAKDYRRLEILKNEYDIKYTTAQ